MQGIGLIDRKEIAQEVKIRLGRLGRKDFGERIEDVAKESDSAFPGFPRLIRAFVIGSIPSRMRGAFGVTEQRGQVARLDDDQSLHTVQVSFGIEFGDRHAFAHVVALVALRVPGALHKRGQFADGGATLLSGQISADFHGDDVSCGVPSSQGNQ